MKANININLESGVFVWKLVTGPRPRNLCTGRDPCINFKIYAWILGPCKNSMGELDPAFLSLIFRSRCTFCRVSNRRDESRH